VLSPVLKRIHANKALASRHIHDLTHIQVQVVVNIYTRRNCSADVMEKVTNLFLEKGKEKNIRRFKRSSWASLCGRKDIK
jgi:hypothetical protein